MHPKLGFGLLYLYDEGNAEFSALSLATNAKQKERTMAIEELIEEKRERESREEATKAIGLFGYCLL